MICYAMQPDLKLLKATAPERIIRKVEDPAIKTLIFAGFENMKMVCYAVFSEPHPGTREIWLDHIYTSPLHREEGFASALLVNAAEHFKELGALCIICRMLVDPVNAGEFSDFFKNNGYLPLNLNGRLLVYDFQDMLDPGVFQLLEKKKSMLPDAVSYENIKKLTAFKTIPMEILEGEEELSCFFVNKGIVYGAAAASKADKTTLVIREVYLEREAEKKGLFLPMLSAVVENARDITGDEMTIHLYLDSEAVRKGFMQMFNPPDEEYLVMEFMKCLLNKNGEVE